MAKNDDSTPSIMKDDAQYKQQLGARLREAREYLGLLQEEVAKYLKIPRSALSHIESGQRRIDALELKRLASLYKQPVSHFTDDEPDVGMAQDIAHLARAAAGLSENDREELARFADYLKARAKGDTSSND